MKKILLALATCLLVVTAQAQTLPPVTPVENQNPIPYSSPALLTSVEVYDYLVNILGSDPVTVAWVITHSETAYGLYYTLDQALAFLPKKD